MKLRRCSFGWLVCALMVPVATLGHILDRPVSAELSGRYRDFALRLEASSGNCDPTLLRSSLAVEELMARGTGDLDVDPVLREAFLAGFRSSFDLGGDICSIVDQGGSYSLLGVRRVDGRPRALFRMIGGSGLNYHDFLLVDGENGSVRIVDFYSYLTGEWFSRTLRRSFLPFVADANGRFVDGLAGSEGVYVRALPRILQMQGLARERRFGDAVNLYEELPEELRADKDLLLLYFNMASQAGQSSYRKALRELTRRYPDDPALDFVLIDHYFYERQFDRALEAINAIDRRVGGDPYLSCFRANVLYVGGRLAEAKRHARRAISRDPRLEDPYWTLVTISLDEGNYGETARLLTAIRTELKIELADLREIPEYADFVRSDAYRRWVAAPDSRVRNYP